MTDQLVTEHTTFTAETLPSTALMILDKTWTPGDDRFPANRVDALQWLNSQPNLRGIQLTTVLRSVYLGGVCRYELVLNEGDHHIDIGGIGELLDGQHVREEIAENTLKVLSAEPFWWEHFAEAVLVAAESQTMRKRAPLA